MDMCNWDNVGQWVPSLAGWATVIGAIFGAAGWLVRTVHRSHDDLNQKLGQRIDNTNQRIDNTNQRIDNTNQRIEDTNQRLDDANRRFEESIKENRMMWFETNKRMDETNQRIDHTYQLILEELKRRNA